MVRAGAKLNKSCSTQWNRQSVKPDSQTEQQWGLPGFRQAAIRLNVTSESRGRRPKTLRLSRGFRGGAGSVPTPEKQLGPVGEQVSGSGAASPAREHAAHMLNTTGRRG